jgi:hypothetical protein
MSRNATVFSERMPMAEREAQMRDQRILTAMRAGVEIKQVIARFRNSGAGEHYIRDLGARHGLCAPHVRRKP